MPDRSLPFVVAWIAVLWGAASAVVFVTWSWCFGSSSDPQLLGFRLWDDPYGVACVFLGGLSAALGSLACRLAASSLGPRWTTGLGVLGWICWLPVSLVLAVALDSMPEPRVLPAMACSTAVAAVLVSASLLAVIRHYRYLDPRVRATVAWAHVVRGHVVVAPRRGTDAAAALPGGPVETWQTPDEALTEWVRKKLGIQLRPGSIRRIETVTTVDEAGIQHEVTIFAGLPDVDDDPEPMRRAINLGLEAGEAMAAVVPEHRPVIEALIGSGVLPTTGAEQQPAPTNDPEGWPVRYPELLPVPDARRLQEQADWCRQPVRIPVRPSTLAGDLWRPFVHAARASIFMVVVLIVAASIEGSNDPMHSHGVNAFGLFAVWVAWCRASSGLPDELRARMPHRRLPIIVLAIGVAYGVATVFALTLSSEWLGAYARPGGLAFRLWEDPAGLATAFLTGAGCSLLGLACALAGQAPRGHRVLQPVMQVGHIACWVGTIPLLAVLSVWPVAALLPVSLILAAAGVLASLAVAFALLALPWGTVPSVRESVAWVHLVGGEVVLVNDRPSTSAVRLPGGPVTAGTSPEDALVRSAESQLNARLRRDTIRRVDTVSVVDDIGIEHRLRTFVALPERRVARNSDSEDGPVVHLRGPMEIADVIPLHRPVIGRLIEEGLLTGMPAADTDLAGALGPAMQPGEHIDTTIVEEPVGCAGNKVVGVAVLALLWIIVSKAGIPTSDSGTAMTADLAAAAIGLSMAAGFVGCFPIATFAALRVAPRGVMARYGLVLGIGLTVVAAVVLAGTSPWLASPSSSDAIGYQLWKHPERAALLGLVLGAAVNLHTAGAVFDAGRGGAGCLSWGLWMVVLMGAGWGIAVAGQASMAPTTVAVILVGWLVSAALLAAALATLPPGWPAPAERALRAARLGLDEADAGSEETAAASREAARP